MKTSIIVAICSSRKLILVAVFLITTLALLLSILFVVLPRHLDISKGILCYSYSAVQDIQIEFSAASRAIVKQGKGIYSRDQLEIAKKDLGAFKSTGKFEFRVKYRERELAHRWIEVNPVTGSLGNGTMAVMDQSASIFIEDLIVTFGFYDAGPGLGGLPKQHQCYVTVVKASQNWMRDLAPPGSLAARSPFTKFVLPSSHDIGMNSMDTSSAIIKHAGTNLIKDVLNASTPHILEEFGRITDKIIGKFAPDIVRALAITQKDSLANILGIGARYFEFRPARCHRQLQRVSPLNDTFYFQHGAIPGMSYQQFLHDIIAFLSQYVHEIVVVQNRWDGVSRDCPRASTLELEAILADALRNSSLRVASFSDMTTKSIDELRSERKRLILLENISQTSNYDDVTSATLSGDSIVQKLQAMGRDPPQEKDIFLIQCQATASNIKEVVGATVIDSDAITSPLLATKATCDHKVLPLLNSEIGHNLTKVNSLVVIMNDFFDGGTADTAISLSRTRLGLT